MAKKIIIPVPTGYTEIGEEDGKVHIRNHQVVTDDLLKRCAAGRADNSRIAPLGDRHGAFRKVGEVPLSFAIGRIPPDAWNDEKAWDRLLTEYEAFKAVRGKL